MIAMQNRSTFLASCGPLTWQPDGTHDAPACNCSDGKVRRGRRCLSFLVPFTSLPPPLSNVPFFSSPRREHGQSGSCRLRRPATLAARLPSCHIFTTMCRRTSTLAQRKLARFTAHRRKGPAWRDSRFPRRLWAARGSASPKRSSSTASSCWLQDGTAAAPATGHSTSLGPTPPPLSCKTSPFSTVCGTVLRLGSPFAVAAVRMSLPV